MSLALHAGPFRAATPPVTPEQLDPSVSPLRLFAVLWRRRYSLLLLGTAIAGLALAGVTLLPVSFTATAAVMIEVRKPSLSDLPTTTGTVATDAVAVRTQVDILRSADLARRVVRQLHLTDLPSFAPHPGRLARLAAAVRGWVGMSAPTGPLSLSEREELAAAILRGITTVVNDGRSYVIDLDVRLAAPHGAEPAPTRALAARIANAVADEYVQFTRQMKAENLRQANAFFDERMATLADKLRTAQHAVQAYRAANGLIEDRAASGEGRPVTVAAQQLAQLNISLIAATADRAQREASLEQIAAALGGRGDLASVPEVIGSPLVQHLRAQQAELGAHEANLAVSSGSANPELRAIRASQADVAAKIAAETAKIAGSLRSAVEAARGRESALRAQLALLQSQVAMQGQTEVRLNELKDEADTARVIYASYLKRAEETANEIDMQSPDAMVVSVAAIPLAPSPPTHRQMAAACLVLGFLAAAFVTLLRERLTAGLRTAEQLEAALGIGLLGLLPTQRHAAEELRLTDRQSVLFEAVASVRAVIRLNTRELPAQVIMVTSALPDEGKTFFATALARQAARADERVLLLDCDLRRPKIFVTAGVAPAGDGRRGAVRGVRRRTAAVGRRAHPPAVRNGTPPVLTITPDPLSPLHLAAAPRGRHASPQDLFASAGLAALLAELRQRYDLIVLDTPPVLAVSDARVLAQAADATVMVVRWGKTPPALVSAALATLRAGGARFAGAVLTRVNPRKLAASDSAYTYVSRRYAGYPSG